MSYDENSWMISDELLGAVQKEIDGHLEHVKQNLGIWFEFENEKLIVQIVDGDTGETYKKFDLAETFVQQLCRYRKAGSEERKEVVYCAQKIVDDLRASE